MRRLLPALASAALAGVALTGCTPFACPAIGYMNMATITVTDTAIVDLECVEGCDGGVNGGRRDGLVWGLDAPGRPETITVVGRDAAGTEVLRREVDLVWTVDDPGNRCGSGATADPVTLGAES